MDILTLEFLDNSILDWLKAVLITASIFILWRIFKRILVKKLTFITERTKSNVDDILVRVIEQTGDFFILLVGFFISIKILKIPDSWQDIINKTFIVISGLQVGLWLGGVINYITSYREKAEGNDKNGKTAIHAFGLFGKIIIWAIITLVTIQNLTGMKMDALITSLGIGGIAVGLAVQNILKDIFASLSIFLDKPFLVSDYIVVGDTGGTVENIGLKSTRIKTLLGEEVVFSNSNLLESRIHNFHKMKRRMVKIKIGVSTDTPYDILICLPALFKEIIEKQENATYDRANLSDLGAYTFDYEIIYHIESADYIVYMNIKEAVYLEIIKQLQEKNVSMPYPTQAVILDK